MTWPTEGNVVQNISVSGGFGGLIGPSGARLPVPYFPSKSSVPVGVPSSGSIGNNGVLTGITAFQLTYSSGIYLYFPANAIQVGSTAGLYWTVMSSVTAGQIFNNQYTGGDPAAPATPIAFATTGPGAYTQTSGTDITVRAITILGGSLGNTGQFRITALSACPGNANSKNFKLNFSTMNFSNIALTTNLFVYVQRSVANRTATSQISQSLATVGPVAGSTALTLGTVDSTVDQSISIIVNIAVATDYMILESGLIEVFPS